MFFLYDFHFIDQVEEWVHLSYLRGQKVDFKILRQYVRFWLVTEWIDLFSFFRKIRKKRIMNFDHITKVPNKNDKKNRSFQSSTGKQRKEAILGSKKYSKWFNDLKISTKNEMINLGVKYCQYCYFSDSTVNESIMLIGKPDSLYMSVC